MAVTDVKRIDHSSETNERGTTCREVYQVTFDAVPSDIRDVLNASYGGVSVPDIGDRWEGSSTIKCKKVGPTVRNPDSNLVYNVPCEYNNIANPSGGVVSSDPLDSPPRVYLDFDVIEVVAEKDNESDPIVNSAGDKFDPPLTELKYLPMIVVERNTSPYSFDPTAATSVVDTVNASAMFIAGIPIAEKQALMKKYTANTVYEGTEEYVRERFEILLASTHALVVADMGYEYIDASDSNKRKRFRDGEGRPSAVPKFLKSDGDDGGGTERYLTFEVKTPASWGLLGLPRAFFGF